MNTVKEHFEERFKEDVSSGCWNWTAGKDKDGYGAFKLDGRQQKAHRFAYQMYVGEIPSGLCICHKCDNPACVNPDHLFPGTQADNMHDRDNKGRWKNNWPDNSGEKCAAAKLTEDDVGTIRTMYANGAQQVDLAKQFGVCPRTICDIVHYHTWKNI